MAHIDGGTSALTVKNPGFLLDRLGEDCHPLQFIRELTQNSIEAILQTSEKEGEIIWDVDWTPYEVGEHQAFKLCITDNGCGMTGLELEDFINQLSSSSSVQSVDGNYGVGAKIAAGTRNHAGLVYLSWKDGVGSMIHFWRDPKSNVYGLRQIELPDGSFDHHATLEDEAKPALIRDQGTKVVLLGMRDDSDTMEPPSPDTPARSRWISRYLNTRYFRVPNGITIKAREGWWFPRENTDSNRYRVVTGQAPYLKENSTSSGVETLSSAKAHWWILSAESLAHNYSHIESAGHVAALYRDELYEMASGRKGQSRLHQFGVIFGQRQVVIYLEPTLKRGLTTNTSRTCLLINGEELPWADWGAEFRENIPEPIKKLMDDIDSKSTDSDHGKSIRERLKNLMDLYKVSRYKPLPSGTVRIAESIPAGGGSIPRAKGAGGYEGGGSVSQGNPSSPVGGVYAAFLKTDGQPGIRVKPDLFPKVKWVSISDGTREHGEIEDRAARYFQDQHMLKINADFRAFTDMIQYWVEMYAKEFGEQKGLKKAIKDSVHDWYEQALVETIIGLQALKGSREWDNKQIAQALSDEALTSVVMQRYHPYNSVKRELGTKISPLKKDSTKVA
jgi:hypothetical protein